MITTGITTLERGLRLKVIKLVCVDSIPQLRNHLTVSVFCIVWFLGICEDFMD